MNNPEYGWTLLDENGNTFLIRGVCYSPAAIGSAAWDINLYSMDTSLRFVDADKIQLMGANTLRIYSPGQDAEGTQKFIRQLYNLYSMYTIFPLPLTMHGADFLSSDYRNKMKSEILEMVRTYKDTPGILVWLLGNEIDFYLTDDKAYWDNKEIREIATPYKKAMARAKIVFEFANEMAAEIKKIDKNHPIGISLGKMDYFNQLKDTVKDIDFIGLNYYQGRTFSSVWGQARNIAKPVLITEFGYDAFNTKTGAEDEKTQSDFIISQWKDIEKNSYLPRNDRGMSLGGCIFEWTDEWWKFENGNTDRHDTKGSWVNPSWSDFMQNKPNVQEEWFGIMKVEKTDTPVDKRVPREVYFGMKNIWKPAVNIFTNGKFYSPEEVLTNSISSNSSGE
jgi:hypothetical protein